jgi:hypothetical protein
LDCKHATHLISQAQDVRLTWRQRLGLMLHLMICDACTQFSKQLHLLREAIRQAGRRIENDDRLKLSQQARERMAMAMEQQRVAITEARQNPDLSNSNFSK